MPEQSNSFSIGPKTIAAAKDMLGNLLVDYQEHINGAYLRGEGALKVDLSLKFNLDNGANNIDAGISFVSERIKDSVSCLADEFQGELFSGDQKQD
jgi:hypothetical protein